MFATMVSKRWMLMFALVCTTLIPMSDAGPAAYGVCVTTCTASVNVGFTIASLISAGFTLGLSTTFPYVTWSGSIGPCTAKCAPALAAPIP